MPAPSSARTAITPPAITLKGVKMPVLVWGRFLKIMVAADPSANMKSRVRKTKSSTDQPARRPWLPMKTQLKRRNIAEPGVEARVGGAADGASRSGG